METKHIYFILGTTCSGKSHTIDKIKQLNNPDIGTIEVGKLMRERFDPHTFGGQGNPLNLKQLAIDIFEEELLKQSDKKVILVDGQPRTIDQIDTIYNNHLLHLSPFDTKNNNVPVHYVKHVVVINKRDDVKEAYMREKYKNDENSLDLSMQRLVNDKTDYFDVLLYLMEQPLDVIICHPYNENEASIIHEIEITSGMMK